MDLTFIYEAIIKNSYYKATAIFIGFFIVSKLVVYISEKVILALTKKTKTNVDDLIIEKTNKLISLILLVIGTRLAVNTLGITETWGGIIDNILYSTIIFFVGLIVLRVTTIIINNWGENWAKKTESTIDDHLISLIKKASNITFLIIITLMILDVWGIEVGPMLASLGIAGIAIAFALQNTLGNIFGGISMIIDKTIKVGDVIRIDADTIGTVLDIGLRSTKIRTFNNEVVIIPNGELSNSKIQNYVLPEPSARVEIPFGTAYGSNIEKVKKIVLKEIKQVQGFISTNEPSVRFLEMAESSLNFTAYFWVESHSMRLSAKDEANTRIYNALNKNKIEIPFPQVDVHLKKK